MLITKEDLEFYARYFEEDRSDYEIAEMARSVVPELIEEIIRLWGENND